MFGRVKPQLHVAIRSARVRGLERVEAWREQSNPYFDLTIASKITTLSRCWKERSLDRACICCSNNGCSFGSIFSPLCFSLALYVYSWVHIYLFICLSIYFEVGGLRAFMEECVCEILGGPYRIT